jgi:hypothetical protein
MVVLEFNRCIFVDIFFRHRFSRYEPLTEVGVLKCFRTLSPYSRLSTCVVRKVFFFCIKDWLGVRLDVPGRFQLEARTLCKCIGCRSRYPGPILSSARFSTTARTTLPLTPYSVGTTVSLRDGERGQRCEADHSPPSSAEVKRIRIIPLFSHMSSWPSASLNTGIALRLCIWVAFWEWWELDLHFMV